MMSSPSISIVSPPSCRGRDRDPRRALLQPRLEGREHRLQLARQRLAVEVARRAPGEGRHPVVHHAAPHLGEVGRARAGRRRAAPPRAAVSSGTHLEPLGVEQRLDVAPHRLAQDVGRHDDAARLELRPAPLLGDQPREPLALRRRRARVGVDRRAARRRASVAEPLPPRSRASACAQPVDLGDDAGQVVDQPVPERRLHRLARRSLAATARPWASPAVRRAHLPTRTLISISWSLS